MIEIGLNVPRSGVASTWKEALKTLDIIGDFPVIIRPAFTLGGTGGGIAYNIEEFEEIIERGLDASMTNQVGRHILRNSVQAIKLIDFLIYIVS